MTNLAILALLMFTAPSSGPDTVRISLFTLFKPEAIHLRVASGEGATLVTGFATRRSIAAGELIRVRLSGNRLNIVIVGSHGAVKQSATAPEAHVVPDGSTTLELIVPGKIRRAVRGSVSVDAGTGERGPLRILLTADTESAVVSVVAAETSRREAEALKALAVVVRTFMLSHRGRHSSEGFDFCDTTHCQLYRGEQDLSEEASSPLVANAIGATARQVLSFDGSTIEGYYTAVCGGLSATPSMVWGGASHYAYGRIACTWCQGSRFYRWERSANAADVLDSLSAFLRLKLSPAASLTAAGDQASGFVRSVIVRDRNIRRVLSTDAFRRAIGLRLGWNTVLSPTFTIERQGLKFIFRGRGFGSQIGLCEAGAVAQAAAGRSYRQILSFYYPGAEIREHPTHE